jgi:hypothetical protein
MDARVTITNRDFREALRLLPRSQIRKRLLELFVSMADGQVRLQTVGIDVGVPATGVWPGVARVPLYALRTLLRMPPESDPVILKVVDGSIWAGGYGCRCTWQPGGETESLSIDGFVLGLPLTPSLTQLVGLGYDLPEYEISRAGCSQIVNNAMAEKDIRVGIAAHALEPFGITEAEIEALVAGRMKGASGLATRICRKDRAAR